MSAQQSRLSALPAVRLRSGLIVHQALVPRHRRRGLAGMPELPSGRALHLRPCRSVHTFGMRFNLDLVWLDRDAGVVRIDRAVAPRRQRTCVRAHSVVEIGAGNAELVLESGYTGRVDFDRSSARFLTRTPHS